MINLHKYTQKLWIRLVNKFNRLDSKSNNNSISHHNRAIDNNQVQALDNSNNTNSGNNQPQQGINNKWVINLSKIPLTQGQESLLAKTSNFAIANKIPNVEYITAVESMYQKLKEKDAEVLRADIDSLLRRVQVHKPNLSQQESTGIAQH